ncbi:hypothetical protein F5Y13DRAFT_160361 [Hypoxylon sp. FL1857]|nr:hypothetical protein F5Y13DRAFT_160361 [Hypoxylon sp. FL1857]
MYAVLFCVTVCVRCYTHSPTYPMLVRIPTIIHTQLADSHSLSLPFHFMTSKKKSGEAEEKCCSNDGSVSIISQIDSQQISVPGTRGRNQGC